MQKENGKEKKSTTTTTTTNFGFSFPIVKHVVFVVLHLYLLQIPQLRLYNSHFEHWENVKFRLYTHTACTFIIVSKKLEFELLSRFNT